MTRKDHARFWERLGVKSPSRDAHTNFNGDCAEKAAIRAGHFSDNRPTNFQGCLTFDSGLTMAQGKFVKVVGWYDNEWGYSNRCVEMLEMIGG